MIFIMDPKVSYIFKKSKYFLNFINQHSFHGRLKFFFKQYVTIIVLSDAF